MPIAMPRPMRKDDESEVLLAETQGRLCEAGPENAKDPDKSAGDPEVRQRPAHRVMVSNVRDALDELR